MWGTYSNNVFKRFGNKVSNYFGHGDRSSERPDVMNLDYHLGIGQPDVMNLEYHLGLTDGKKREYVTDVENLYNDGFQADCTAQRMMEYMSMSVRDLEKHFGKIY